MSRTAAIILALVAFGLGAGAGVGGFLWATGGNAEPSRDASEVAGTLSLDDPAPEETGSTLDLTSLNTSVDALAAQTETEISADGEISVENIEAKINAIAENLAANAASGADEDVAAPAATEEVSADSADSADTADTGASADSETASGERVLYRITTDGSEARFKIDEELSGSPIEVVGITSEVAGDIIVDFANPENSQLGVIAVNARTLETDNNFRNQALRSRILNSSQDQYEFVTFTPTSLVGLPESVSVGDTIEFQIVGDLQIRDTVREVTFDATVNVVSEDRLEGSAVTLVMYRDFGITIQAPPQVANIGEEVDIEIDFVATQVES